MDMLALMRSRRSVRTFDGEPLRAEDADKILAFAQKVENPYDLPIAWQLLDAKKDGLSSPVIVGTNAYIARKMTRAPHAEEAFGYTFEKVVLFAESMGVGTTWIAGTMDRQAFERAVRLGENEVMPCVSPLGYAAKKMSLRETMMRKGIRADSRLDFGELFFRASFNAPLSPENAGELAAALEAVRLAPSAVNKQPWRVVLIEDKAHFYLKHSRGRIAEGGWDIRKIDVGIALCHFELAASQYGKRVSFEISDPGVAAGEDTEYIASYAIA
ncbi:MAG: nitroreductase family protein [Clostridia bacterium]|nr:nitroreductase family protein [Clostridia bacterium]